MPPLDGTAGRYPAAPRSATLVGPEHPISPYEVPNVTMPPEPPPYGQQPYSPPPAGQPYQPYPPPPAKKSHKTLWIILGVVGGLLALCCLGGIFVIGGVGKAVKDDQDAAAKDVTISKCASENEIIGPQATVQVTNSSKRRASYSVEVTFESTDGATQYGSSVAFVNNLEPGQTGSADAASFSGDKGISQFKCRVTKVTRL
jgi:hypothetical protein